MQTSLRVSIAFIAGCLISRNCYGYVFDQSQDRVLRYTCSFDLTYITVHDYDTASDITGMIQGNAISFHHSGQQISFTMNLNGDAFTGTAGAANSYNGTVMDRIVKLYDYQEGKSFHYCLINETGG